MRLQDSESGVAMLFAIISIFLLLLLGAIMAFFAWRDTEVGTLSRFSQQAFFAAEAGQADALIWLDRRVNPPALALNQTTNREGQIRGRGIAVFPHSFQAFNTTIELLNVSVVPGSSIDTFDYTFRMTSEGVAGRRSLPNVTTGYRRGIETVASRIW